MMPLTRPLVGTYLSSLSAAALFTAAVLVSFALSAPDSSFATIWLPSGLYLALLLRRRREAWPAVIAGCIGANIATEMIMSGRAVVPAIGFALVNTLEAVSGALLMAALGGVPTLNRVADVVRLVTVALVVAAIPGALVGTLVVDARASTNVAVSWLTWWIADVIGIVIVTPGALIPLHEWRTFARQLRGWRGLEATVAFATLILVAAAIYWLPPHPTRASFLLLPWLLWITFRFGAPGLFAGMLMVTVVVVRGTLAGGGPLATLPRAEAVLFVQVFVSVGAICFLFFATTLREREATAAQLRRHEQDALVRQFADTAPAILWASELSGQRTFLSRGWMELTGQVAASGLGSGWLQTVHADDRDHVVAQSTAAMRSGIPYQVRYRVRSADGSFRWVMSAGRPQLDEQGNVLGYVGSLIDVHDQTLAASALARADALLDAVFQSAPVGLAFLDRDLRFQRINERLAAINGLSIAAHIGRTPPDLLPGIDDMSGIMAGFRHIVTTGEPRLGVEVSGETPATPGQRRLWRENFFPVTVAGDVVGVGIVAEDVTEQRRTEQALRESEARFRKLAEEGPVIVWVTAGARVQYLSPRWSDYTGQLVGDAGLEAIVEPVHPDDRARIRQEWFESSAGTAFETEFRLRRCDGSFRWFLSRGVAMAGEGGGVQRVGAYVDIHDRKVAERDLLDAGRRKDEFLAMLAHELRNPLAPIQNAVRLLEVAPAGSAAQSAARDVINRQLTHVVRLVDDLLDVSRLSRGKLSIRREPTDLAAVLRDTAHDQQPQFDDAGIRFELYVPAHPVWIDGDRTRLAQLIGNLLHNAQKFTAVGGAVRLTMDADFANGLATVRVEDTGIGMTPDLLTCVFDEFSQGTQSLDRTPGGLGLGLALVKKFAELHGGHVEARSDGPDRGSTFVVQLPVRRSEREPASADAVNA